MTMMHLAEGQTDNDIAVVRRVALRSEASSLMTAIIQAASDPAVDITKIERLTALHQQMQDRAAKVAFGAELAKLQPELPTIEQNGRIVIHDKADKKNVVQSTPYALYADINEAIRTPLSRHGFSLTHRIGATAEGKITVTGILRHEEGHAEDTTMILKHDGTGSKNEVQAIASSISYGRRITALLLLNITSRSAMERDDDGQAAGGDGPLSEEQLATIQGLIMETNANIEAFCRVMKAATVAEIRASQFQQAHDALIAKRNLIAKKAKVAAEATS